MRVLLISANTERINMATPPLGLGFVAAATRKAGHETHFLDLIGEADPGEAVRREIRDVRPEAVGISIRNIDDQDRENPRFLLEQAGGVVSACREASEAPVILGGAGYSILPDAALGYLEGDWGVRGEGEAVFPELLDRLEQGESPGDLPGVHAAGGGAAAPVSRIKTLDDQPFPGQDWYRRADPLDPGLWLPVQSRRGCPMGCSYCSTPAIEGAVFRRRSPRLMVEEVGRLRDAGYRRFYFVDNVFNLPRSYALDLCKRIRSLEMEIQWRCILYPWGIDEDFVRSLAEAGCVEAALGFESCSEDVLRELCKRFGPEEIRRSAGLLADHGIRTRGFLLLGGPGETRETVEESLGFAESLNLEFMMVTVGIRIYPETGLADRAREEGIIDLRDDLLRPRFYLVPELDGWLQKRVRSIQEKYSI